MHGYFVRLINFLPSPPVTIDEFLDQPIIVNSNTKLNCSSKNLYFFVKMPSLRRLLQLETSVKCFDKVFSTVVGLKRN